MIKSFNQLILSKAIILDNLGESDLIIWKGLEKGLGLSKEYSWGVAGRGQIDRCRDKQRRNSTCVQTASACVLRFQSAYILSFLITCPTNSGFTQLVPTIVEDKSS